MSTTAEVETPKTCYLCNKQIGNYWVESFRIENGERVDQKFSHDECQLKIRVEEYQQTKIITSKLHLQASLLGELDSKTFPRWAEDILTSMVRVEELQREWELSVWFGGSLPTSKTINDHGFQYKKLIKPTKSSLQEFVRKASAHGYSSEVGEYKYHSYTIAGRSCFQIERGDSLINLICDETSAELRGGIQGIHATAEIATQLIRQSIDDWKSGKIKLKRSKVGII